MSVRFSTINSDMIESGYLRALALSLAAWLSLYLIFTWTIDPYGVSPIRLEFPRINALKPKRTDIDRILKPYEVWRYQPRTIFLGTSRANHSLDPSTLDGTRFAPAYNAAIPGGASMKMHAAYLEQYLRLDHNLRTVIVELFLPHMVGGATPTWADFIGNTVSLFASANTLWDSLVTLAYNLELIFLIGPSHPYPDYYYDVIGAWGVIEEWLTKLSALATVYSFSQPNDWVDEPISPHMTYWYDTFHYSLAMGRGMLRSLAGVPTSGLPDNFMERLTPERVASHIERRRAAARRWAQDNPSLVAQFEEARRKWLAAERTPH